MGRAPASIHVSRQCSCRTVINIGRPMAALRPGRLRPQPVRPHPCPAAPTLAARPLAALRTGQRRLPPPLPAEPPPLGAPPLVTPLGRFHTPLPGGPSPKLATPLVALLLVAGCGCHSCIQDSLDGRRNGLGDHQEVRLGDPEMSKAGNSESRKSTFET